MTKRAEESRRYRQKNRAVLQQRWAAKSADPEFRRRERERNRGYREVAHSGGYSKIVALLWEQQAGCCYLCGAELVEKQAVLDHDHRCCPKGKTCSACRRGLACQRCNRLIGQADDDPDLLRRIADNLEHAVEAAQVRIADKPVQLEIDC